MGYTDGRLLDALDQIGYDMQDYYHHMPRGYIDIATAPEHVQRLYHSYHLAQGKLSVISDITGLDYPTLTAIQRTQRQWCDRHGYTRILPPDVATRLVQYYQTMQAQPPRL